VLNQKEFSIIPDKGVTGQDIYLKQLSEIWFRGRLAQNLHNEI